MRRRLAFRPAVMLFLMLALGIGFGQDPTGAPATGLPRFSTTTSGHDQINLGNLNVHWEFPIFSKPGRGLPFRLVLTFDNSLWAKNTPSAPGFWMESLGPGPGWSIRTTADGPGGSLVATSAMDICNSITGETIQQWTQYQYFDSSNVKHDFPGSFLKYDQCHNPFQTSSGPVMASDGSGYLLNPDTSNITTPSGQALSFALTGGDGQVSAAITSIADSNGNILGAAFVVPPTPCLFRWQDTLGLSVVTVSVGIECPPLYNEGPAFPPYHPDTYTYIDSNGNSQTVTVNYKAYKVKSNFQCAGVASEFNSNDWTNFYPNGWVPLVDTIVYPDGRTYSFTYEPTPGDNSSVTARLKSVTLPTGGGISYSYPGANDGINCSLGSTTDGNDSSTLSLTRQTPDGTTTYTRSNVSGAEWKTVVTYPADSVTGTQSKTDIYFQNVYPPTANSYDWPLNEFYEVKRQVFQGSDSGSPLETVHTCYNGSAPDCAATKIILPISQITVRTELSTAQKTQTVTFMNATGQVTEKDEYDYGSNAVGPVVRKTLTTYAALGNNILNRPASVTVQDGLGNQVAQIKYFYDEVAPSATSGVPNHNTVTGSRGNATTVQRWLNTASGFLSTSNEYDDTGNLVARTNPLGNKTQFSHADSFSDGVDRHSLAYVTKTTLPDTNSPNLAHHVTSAKYDANTGLIVSSNDQNGNKTDYTYDLMMRPLTVTSPADPSGNRPKTTLSYPDANTVKQQKAITTSLTDTNTAQLDGLGRVAHLLHATPNGTATTDATYDSLGRLFTVTNPYFTTSDPTFGIISYQYDALGRMIQTTKQDGSLVAAQYSGNCTTNTDEAGRSRRACTDALGRLTEVDEPQPSAVGTSATASVTISGGPQIATITGGTIPLPAIGTRMVGFQEADGKPHAFYQSTSQHIIHVFQGSSGGWQAYDVTANSISGNTTNHQPASGSPLTGLANPGGHVNSFYFLDANQHIHESYDHNDNVWYDNDFTTLFGLVAAAPNSTLFVYPTSNSIDMHLHYVGTDQHIHDLHHNNVTGWSDMDVTANSINGNTTNHQPASGTSLTGLADPGGGANSFYFLDANQHIHETYDHNDEVWHDNDFMTLFGLGAAAPGTPLTVYAGAGSIDMHLHYLGADQHIHDLYHNTTTGWAGYDVTANATLWQGISDQPAAGTPLTALLNSGGGAESVYYLDPNQHVHESYAHNDERWIDVDYFATFGIGSAAPGSALISYATPTPIDLHVHYLRGNQHLYDVYHNSSTGWAEQDVNSVARLDVSDSGTVSLNVGGFTATACFGPSTNPACSGQSTNSGANAVAAALGQVLNGSDSPVSVTVSGSTINMIWKTPGPFTPAVNALITMHDNPSLFSNPSFTSPATSFSGGTDGLGSNPYVTLYSYDALGNLLTVTQKGGTDSAQWRVRNFTYDSLSRLLTATNPESGIICYGTWNQGSCVSGYDADSNLLKKTSAAPNQNGSTTQTISYCYDALNRITSKAYSAQSCPLTSPVVTYSYDSGTNGIGYLTGLTDQAGSGSYAYDALGRITTEQRTIAGMSKNMSYAYNLDNSIAKLTYPSAAAVTYAPDGAGRMLSASDTVNSINYVTSATYGPDNSLTGLVNGNSSTFSGITGKLQYNRRLQLCRTTSLTAGTLPNSCTDAVHLGNVFDLGYNLNSGLTDNGNVVGITNYRDPTRNQTFTYDALNRLGSAKNAGTDCTVILPDGNGKFWGNTYTYDAWGNLTNKGALQNTCAGEGLNVPATSKNQMQNSVTCYDASGNLVTTATYCYDAAGNLRTDGSGRVYSYDQENRISGAGGYTYTYDADGNRVKKSNGSTGTIYWYMSSGIIAESDLTGALKSEYVFFEGQRVARRDFPGNAVLYYFSDHRATASVIADASGTIKAESDYYPFGGELQIVNNDSNHYKFSGKERDTETKLDYSWARHYSYTIGRWASADPAGIAVSNLAAPQGLNLYGYVVNNPMTLTDPFGLTPPEDADMSQQGEASGRCAMDGALAPCTIVTKLANAPTRAVIKCPFGDCTQIPYYVDGYQKDDVEGEDYHSYWYQQFHRVEMDYRYDERLGQFLANGDRRVYMDIWHCSGCPNLWRQSSTTVNVIGGSTLLVPVFAVGVGEAAIWAPILARQGFVYGYYVLPPAALSIPFFRNMYNTTNWHLPGWFFIGSEAVNICRDAHCNPFVPHK